MLFEISSRLISKALKCSRLPSPMLNLLSDSLEYFRIHLKNESSKKSKEKSHTPLFYWRLSKKRYKCCSLTSQSYLRSVSSLNPSCVKFCFFFISRSVEDWKRCKTYNQGFKVSIVTKYLQCSLRKGYTTVDVVVQFFSDLNFVLRNVNGW